MDTIEDLDTHYKQLGRYYEEYMHRPHMRQHLTLHPIEFSTKLYTYLLSEGFASEYQPNAYRCDVLTRRPHSQWEQYIFIRLGVQIVVIVVGHSISAGCRVGLNFRMKTDSIQSLVTGLHRVRERHAVIEHCIKCDYSDKGVMYCGMGYQLGPSCMHGIPKAINSKG
jgi:hypothetical protein